jgi:lipase chaperone LimK
MSDPLSAEDEAVVQLIVGRIIGRARREAMPTARDVLEAYEQWEADLTMCREARAGQQAEIERLRSALKPLADLAVAIDGNESCAVHKRSDRSTIWQGNAMQRGPWDITMAHARAARAAMEVP